MTVPFWPSDLPCRVQREGSTQTLADGRIRQEMDAGPPKVRRRTSASVGRLTGSIVAGFDGRARFERFWFEEVRNGSLPFFIKDQFADGVALLTANGVLLLTDTGAPLLIASWWLVMFGQDAPAITRLSPQRWSISFGLDILP